MATIPINALFVPLDENFILAYGEALLEWSYVENRMYRWFRHLAKLQDGMARAVFFSARSFQGRSDMLAAAIEQATFAGPRGLIGRQAISEALDKAISYSKFRNALAHGMVISEYSEKGRRELLVQGKHPVHMHSATGVTIDQLKIAGKNFAALANDLSQSLRMYEHKDRPVARQRQLQECVERLLMLPNEPECEKPSQKQLGRQRQRKSDARRKSRKS